MAFYRPGLGELVLNQTELLFNQTTYISTNTDVIGMDILISLLLVQTIFLGVIVYNTLNRSEKL